MKIVRKSVFETNSSSCHSLSISSNTMKDIRNSEEFKRVRKEYVLANKSVKVELEGYCGGNFFVSSFEKKLSYIFSDFAQCNHGLVDIKYNFPKNLDIQALVDSVGTPRYVESKGLNSEEMQEYLEIEGVQDLIAYLKDTWNIEVEFVAGYSGWVGVDHESDGLGRNLTKDKEELAKFLFDTDSTIWVEHDG